MNYQGGLNCNTYQGLMELGGSALNKTYGCCGGGGGGQPNISMSGTSSCCSGGVGGSLGGICGMDCGNPNVTICHCCRLIFATNQSHLIDEHLSSKGIICFCALFNSPYKETWHGDQTNNCEQIYSSDLAS